MKKILLMAIVFSTTSLIAQKETFDIATFTRPKGWQRLDTNGVTLLYHSKTNNGLTDFCQIFLFPSRDANDDAAKNFQDDWTDHIMRATGTTTRPQTQTNKTPDGWTAVSGRADVSQNGTSYTCMLTAVTGHGKEMSFVVNVAGQEYVDDVRVFFESVDLIEMPVDERTEQAPRVGRRQDVHRRGEAKSLALCEVTSPALDLESLSDSCTGRFAFPATLLVPLYVVATVR